MNKIVSGGQDGVDVAALDAALDLRIPIGGYCPAGRRCESGTIDEKYPLIETIERDYLPRTRLNVQHSDATMLVRWGAVTPGTRETERLAAHVWHRPYRWLDLALSTRVGADWMDLNSVVADAADLVEWLKSHNIINVAGPRESKRPGIYDLARRTLTKLFLAAR